MCHLLRIYHGRVNKTFNYFEMLATKHIQYAEPNTCLEQKIIYQINIKMFEKFTGQGNSVLVIGFSILERA